MHTILERRKVDAEYQQGKRSEKGKMSGFNFDRKIKKTEI